MKPIRALGAVIASMAALTGLLLSSGVSAQAGAPGQAGASVQIYPAKPIKLVVDVPPGGVEDALARAIAQQIVESLKQQVVVENRPGANGNLGADAVAKAPNDGHMLLVSSGGALTLNPSLYAKMPFDAERDLMPVAAVVRVPAFLVAHPALPAKSVAELIAQARANPNKLKFASAGNGSASHLSAEVFKRRAKFEVQHVAFGNAAQALSELLAGQAHFMFDAGPALKHVREGQLKLLAVGGAKRSAQFPNTPTLAELGIAGFDTDSVISVYAPAGTPAAIIEMLNEEVTKTLTTPKVVQIVKGFGAEATALGRAEFAEREQKDRERYGAFVREIGLKLE